MPDYLRATRALRIEAPAHRNIVLVQLDGPLGDPEPGGNVLIVEASRDVACDSGLPPSQPWQARQFRKSLARDR